MENAASKIKLNLGCGFKKKPEFVNVDRFEGCQADQVLDLVKDAWPWERNSVSEVHFDFSMEQMGTTAEDLKKVLQETYRVCSHEAKILVTCYHPRHDQFYLNPLCTQRLSPDFFSLLSVGKNLQMIGQGSHDDCLGLMWGVNFEIKNVKTYLNSFFEEAFKKNEVTEDELKERLLFENNIVHVFEVELSVVKDRA